MRTAEALRHTAANLLFARTPSDPTSEIVPLEALGLEHEDRCPYHPSPWWILHWVLPKSLVRPGDVFVEFGCGKGRVVLAAARRYPFAEVIGVELSSELSAAARDVVASERRLRASSVRIETADATVFEVPDQMTHAYMFNPFTGDTMARVCENIVASMERAPRSLRLIYVEPHEHAIMLEHGFRLERRLHTTRTVGRVNVGIYTR